MSTNIFNKWENPDGSENYKCRAWVNFNGTGTVAIRAAGNVSSILDNGVGNYTLNFLFAMPDANYSAIMTTLYSGGPYLTGHSPSSFLVGSYQMFTSSTAGGLVDATHNTAAFYR